MAEDELPADEVAPPLAAAGSSPKRPRNRPHVVTIIFLGSAGIFLQTLAGREILGRGWVPVVITEPLSIASFTMCVIANKWFNEAAKNQPREGILRASRAGHSTPCSFASKLVAVLLLAAVVILVVTHPASWLTSHPSYLFIVTLVGGSVYVLKILLRHRMGQIARVSELYRVVRIELRAALSLELAAFLCLLRVHGYSEGIPVWLALFSLGIYAFVAVLDSDSLVKRLLQPDGPSLADLILKLRVIRIVQHRWRHGIGKSLVRSVKYLGGTVVVFGLVSSASAAAWGIETAAGSGAIVHEHARKHGHGEASGQSALSNGSAGDGSRSGRGRSRGSAAGSPPASSSAPTTVESTTTTSTDTTMMVPCDSDLDASLLSEFEEIGESSVTAPRYAAVTQKVIDNVGPTITGCPQKLPTITDNFIAVPLTLPDGKGGFEVVVTQGGKATLIDPGAIASLNPQLSNPTLLSVDGMYANSSLTDATDRRAFLYVLGYENGTSRLLLRTAPQNSFLLLPTSVTDIASAFATEEKGYLTIRKQGDTFAATVNNSADGTDTTDLITYFPIAGDATDKAPGVVGVAYEDSVSPDIQSLLSTGYPYASNYMANATDLCGPLARHEACSATY